MKWSYEYGIDRTVVMPNSENRVHRRRFLQYLMTAFSAPVTALGVAFPVISYLWPPARTGGSTAGGRVAVSELTNLPQGEGRVFSVNHKPVIVINTSDGTKALSAVCTHLACIVYWDQGRGVIACPCHAGFSTIRGEVISGPPPAPLASYRVQVEGGKIHAETPA